MKGSLLALVAIIMAAGFLVGGFIALMATGHGAALLDTAGVADIPDPDPKPHPQISYLPGGETSGLEITVVDGRDTLSFDVAPGGAPWHRTLAATTYLYGQIGDVETFSGSIQIKGEDASIRAFPSVPPSPDFTDSAIANLSRLALSGRDGVANLLVPEAWFREGAEGGFREVRAEPRVDQGPENFIFVARELELGGERVHVPARRNIDSDRGEISDTIDLLIASGGWPVPEDVVFEGQVAGENGMPALKFNRAWWGSGCDAAGAAKQLMALTLSGFENIDRVRLVSADGGEEIVEVPKDPGPSIHIAVSEEFLPRYAQRDQVTLNAVGDVIPARNILQYLEEYGDWYVFEAAARDLGDGDLAFMNLEAPLARGGTPLPGGIRFRGRPETAAEFHRAGISIINMANNHSMDMGREGFRETVSHLRDYGYFPLGAGLDDEDARRPVIWEGRGERIAFLGYTHYHDVFWDWDGRETFAAGPELPGVAGIVPEHMMADVEHAKSVAPTVVVSCHWGTEYVYHPDEEYHRLARDLVDAGVDAILGHHPHVLQGVEVYSARPILFSLGNFIFDQMPLPRRRTAIARILWEPREGGGLTPKELEMIPYLIEDMRPAPANPDEARAILDHLEEVSKSLGTDSWRRGDDRLLLSIPDGGH